jgi:hypothetical protein
VQSGCTRASFKREVGTTETQPQGIRGFLESHFRERGSSCPRRCIRDES